MRQEMPSEVIGHIYRVFSKSTDKCLEPTEKCQLVAIQSHSIPNAQVLARLSRDGHVVIPHTHVRHTSRPEIEFKLVGRNKATTFSGLCSHHDGLLFRPIDIQNPDVHDPSHLFLLAYRAVLREFHSVIQGAVRLQSVYKKRIDANLDAPGQPSRAGIVATEFMCNAFDTYEYKRRFDLLYLANDWSELAHRVIELQGQRPTIAVSSMFSLDDVDPICDESPRICLSVFPRGQDTVVVISSTRTDEVHMDRLVQRMLSANSFYQKYLLSKLILANCDNFVLSPSYFDAISPDRKEAILSLLNRMDIVRVDDYEDDRIYLF